MSSSHDTSTLEAALQRNLAELNNAVLKITAHDVLLRQDITYVRMSFFVIAANALYNDLIAHAIKVLDEHRDAMSFWYIFRCNESAVKRAAKNAELDIEALKDLSVKLRTVREKTHFHIDRKSVKNSKQVWSDADIFGPTFAATLSALERTLAIVKQEMFGGELHTITEYDGSDIPKIIKAYEDTHSKVHGV